MAIFFMAVAVLALFAWSCQRSGGDPLRTESAGSVDVQGTYRLLLDGCSSGDDIANVAIFDREGDPNSFEIHASETAHTVTTGLAAAEALKQAERFIRCNINVEGSELRRVLSASGAGIGYELRPRYPVTLFGAAEVLEIRYRLRDRRVVVRIMTAPAIERQRAA